MSALPITSSDYIKEGVLDKWVKQPTDSSPMEASNGEITYQEKWKGPYDSGRLILNSVKAGDTITSAHSALGQKYEQISYPACPTRNDLAGTWRVKDIRVEELTPGDHCNIHFKFYADYSTRDVLTLTEIDELDVWSISWQAYSLAPWSFCSNSGGEPKPWSPSYDLSPPQPLWSEGSSRSAIEVAMSHNPEIKGNFIVYAPDKNVPDCKMYLDAPSKAIRDKAVLDRECIRHYPIISHLTVSRGGYSATYNKQLGKNIDKVCELSGCPFSFPNDWVFIKTGDDMQQLKQESKQLAQFTRHETFMGMLSSDYDPNFYGTANFTHTQQGISSGRWYPKCI